jgi:hypothetical protein
MSGEDKPVMSRTSRTGAVLVELRTQTPKFITDVCDSVAMSETASSGKMVSRTDVVNRILGKFALDKIHEASLIVKIASEYPTVLEEEKQP